MARSRGTFSRGQTGNPKGRPSKTRALTEILEKAGRDTQPNVEGDMIERRRLVARMLWDAATTGEVALPNGETLSYGAKDWLDLVKFLYGQIDGPVKPLPPEQSDEVKPSKGKIPTFEDLKNADPNDLIREYRQAAGEA